MLSSINEKSFKKVLTVILLICFVLTGMGITAKSCYGASGNFALGSVIKSKDGRGYATTGSIRYSYYTNAGAKISDTMTSTGGNHLTVGGRKGYCVEFGIKYPGTLNSMSIDKAHRLKYLPEGRKLGIKFAGLYGMQNSSKKVPAELRKKCNLGDWYWATQCIMWEYQTGLRTGPTSSLNSRHFYNTLKNRPGRYAYNWMNDRITQHAKLWSFASDTAKDALKEGKPAILKWNPTKERYETKLNDRNRIVYPLKMSKRVKVKFNKNGNSYTFYSSKALNEATAYKLTKDAPSTSSKFLIWSEGSYGQTICTTGYSSSIYGYKAFATEENGTLKLTKTNEDGIVEGFKFEFYDVNGKKAAEGTTDKDGLISVSLKPGTYTVKEILTSEQEELYEQPADQQVNIESAKEASVNFANKIRSRQLILVKKDGDSKKPLEGAIIGVYDKKTGKLIQKGTTDENGEVRFSLEIGKKYYYKEIEAPLGYILNGKKHEFVLKKDADKKVTMLNDRYKQKIVITKADIDTGKPLAGAKYEILDKDKNRVYVGETGTKGKWTVTDVPLGKYYYHELKAPSGYELNEATYEFELKKYGEVEKITAVDQILVKKPNHDAPNTGDNSMMELSGFLALAAIATLALIMLKRKIIEKSSIIELFGKHFHKFYYKHIDL